MEEVKISAFDTAKIIDKVMDQLTIEERRGLIDLMNGDDDCWHIAIELINAMSDEEISLLDLTWWCLFEKDNRIMQNIKI